LAEPASDPGVSGAHPRARSIEETDDPAKLAYGGVLTARRPQEADDSEVVGAVLPFSELDPPDDESPGVPELEEVFFDGVVVLVPDDSVGSDLRESLR